MAKGFGIAALVVVIVALLTPLVGLFVSMLALILATIAASAGDRIFSTATALIATINTFFLSPSTWILLDQSKRDPGVAAPLWVLGGLVAVVFIAMMLNASGSLVLGANKSSGEQRHLTAHATAVAKRPEPSRAPAWRVSAILMNGNILNVEIPSNAPPQTIGRSKEKADIVLDDSSVSRRHARLEPRDGALWLSDLGSLNGTHVDEQRVGQNPVRLHVSNQIRLGDVRLTISAL